MFSLNKKAMLFEPLLVLFAILILSASFYYLVIQKNTSITFDNLGKESSKIIEINEEYKLKKSLIEQQADYSILYSIYELGQNSGFNLDQIKKCKIWNDCKLTKEKIINNLQEYIQKNFNAFVLSQNLKPYNVKLIINSNKIKINILGENIDFGKENINFLVNHNFEKEINYNINKYEELYNKFSKEDRLESCPIESEKELIENNLFCKDEKEFLLFEYNQDKLYLNNQNSFEYPEELHPTIKFKIRKLLKIQPSFESLIIPAPKPV